MDRVGMHEEDASRVRRGVGDELQLAQWRREHCTSVDRVGRHWEGRQWNDLVRNRFAVAYSLQLVPNPFHEKEALKVVGRNAEALGIGAHGAARRAVIC